MNLSPDSDAALPPEDLALLRNHSFDELEVGDSASLERTLSTQDLRCLLYTSPSPRDLSTSRMPSSA